MFNHDTLEFQVAFLNHIRSSRIRACDGGPAAVLSSEELKQSPLSMVDRASASFPKPQCKTDGEGSNGGMEVRGGAEPPRGRSASSRGLPVHHGPFPNLGKAQRGGG